MTAGSYLLSTLELLLYVGAVGFTAVQIRRWLVSAWCGAIARLTEVVIAVSLAILLGEALGLFGWMKELPLLGCSVAIALPAWRLSATRPQHSLEKPLGLAAIGWPAAAAAAIVAALVFAKWALGALPILDEGMWGFDTVQYHMPVAAGFAQSGSVTGLHFIDPLSFSEFYPANSELIHGEAIAIVGSDVFSPLINLGWLSLALLAAWCIGRPYGRAPISVLALGSLLVAPTFLIRQPGQAMNDTAGLAFLLCSAAILLMATDTGESAEGRITPRSTWPVLLAALAAGAALGTKPNLIPEVIGLGIGVTIVAVRYSRVRVATTWVAGAIATGGYWYARNLVATGNPAPWFGGLSLGPVSVPAPDRISSGVTGHPITQYLTDGAVWHSYFLPGLKVGLGEVWPLLLGLAAVGILAAIALPGTPLQRVLGATALLGLVAYASHPWSAAGAEGHPTYFALNIRLGVPPLALALALLPTLRLFRLPAVTPPLVAVLAIVLAVNLGHGTSLDDPYLGGAAALTAIAVIAAALAAGPSAGFLRPLDAALFGLALIGVAVLLYWPQVQQYQEKRYTAVWSGMYLTRAWDWARNLSNARIALVGTEGGALQYPFYGKDSSNQVVYLGTRGPHGAFNPIQTCQEWRAAMNAGDFDYIVTTPSLDYISLGTGFSPEQSWTMPGGGTTRILKDGPVSVFRVDGRLDPAACPEDAFSGLAPLLKR